MSDMDVFEQRFVRAYQRYLDQAPVQIDADALARRVVGARRPALLSGWSSVFRNDRPMLWVVLAALLSLALIGSLLAAGAARVLDRSYPPVLTGSQSLVWMSRAVSGDELWIMGDGGLWHYVGDAWQGPISPAPLDGQMVSGLALGPDGALLVSGDTTVANLRSGQWRAEWEAPFDGLRSPVVAADGTVWVARGADLIALPRVAGQPTRTVTCPQTISRIAAATDGALYVGGFWYAGGTGLARSDGTTCANVDPLGDGQIHEVGEIAAGPGGSVAASLLDENGDFGACCRGWVALLQDGRWSTIWGPAIRGGVSTGLAIAPDGHPWFIDATGLMRYGDGAWRMVAESAHSLALAPDGVLWYERSRSLGIERLNTDQFGK
jgi:hypothetical protein